MIKLLYNLKHSSKIAIHFFYILIILMKMQKKNIYIYILINVK